MTYFPDLAPYAYGFGAQPGLVHVGWLDGTHLFPKGRVESRLIEKMKVLARNPVELYRARHLCELCVAPAGPEKAVLPNGVIVTQILRGQNGLLSAGAMERLG